MFRVESAIERVKGFRVAGVHAGLKPDNAPDFALVRADRACAAAGVFTTNTVKAAPVLFNMARLDDDPANIRAVAINTVSANACTGKQGMTNSRRMAELIAEHSGLDASQVLVMSTGVIGTQLPMSKIECGAELSTSRLAQDWETTARAIMTTDTRPKLASTQVLTSAGEYTIAGISKGSGMIAPNMATMLGIVVTDAALTPDQTQQALTAANRASFNRIVVDGDTSTNDMVVLLASGASGVDMTTESDMAQFTAGLTAVCRKLAQDIVRDGEGATKFITLDVRNAGSEENAARIAHTIAASPLVKTAFFGNDANVGRLIAAAGRAGVSFNPETAALWLAAGESLEEDDRGLLLFEYGMFIAYSEAAATEIIQDESVYVTLDCGAGPGSAIVWTCDLSHEYVSINADYRT